MAWKLYYYNQVAIDIIEAKQWYKKRQKYLDKRFAEDVKISINRLQKNPLHYEVKYRNIRIAFCDIFPYAIHFFIDDTLHGIVIVAIVHQHRNPEYPASR